jgi:integrase
MAWLEKRGSKYVICDRDAAGKRIRIPAYTDRQASKQKLARYEKAKAHGAEGLIDPFEEHKARPLAEHVADYIADLRALGRDGKYVYNCDKRLAKLTAECGWKALGDITADSFCLWRERLPRMEDGRSQLSPRSQNQYLEVVRTFCGWCVKRKRAAENPVTTVQKVDESTDVRRARRSLTAEEFIRLLAAVPEGYRGVYRFILATGLRRQEVEDLAWGDIRLNSPTPFIKLRAKATKSRRADSLPLRSDLAEDLRKLRGESGDADRVFPSVPTIEEHREYLTEAGIEWEDSEGRRADIHALRHTYGTLLSQSGATPREAMELMRHTDLSLTMKVYTDPRIFDLAGAVERLPIPASSIPATAVATGTDGQHAYQNPAVSMGAQMGATSTIEGHSTAVIGRASSEAGSTETLANAGDLRPLTPTGNDGQEGEKNSAGRTRTYNQPVNSRLLYH